MTVVAINSVGFCAHYSPQGDWAFQHALRLARQRSLQLNVFHFMCDPYETADCVEERHTRAELERMAFERERELRMYYDELAGDYLDVGFRLCWDRSWRELHRCLMIGEFQVLFLARPTHDARFSGLPIEEFAHGFVCPVALVGPNRPNQVRLNSSAALVADKLGIPAGDWERIELGPRAAGGRPGVHAAGDGVRVRRIGGTL